MPPRKRKETSAPDPPRKRTRSETAKNAPDPSESDPDEGDTEAGGSTSRSNQRRSVHWSTDTKPTNGSDADGMIYDLLSSDPEHDLEVDELESSPQPKRTPKKITLRFGSKQVNSSSKTKQENNPSKTDDGILVAYESPNRLAFAIHKNSIKQRTVAIPLDINYATFRQQVADEYQVAAHGMDLNYKTTRMAKSDSWCGLASLEDFESIIQNARSSIASDAERHRLAIIKNAADAKSAQKRGRDHVPKPVAPVRQFVILVRDQNFDKNAKASGSKKDKKSKSESEEGKVATWKDLAKQIIEYKKQLTARKCNISLGTIGGKITSRRNPELTATTTPFAVQQQSPIPT
ncbi:unnamed protein product [Rhizoctonia solani]|uniref:Uncharacterized protein n=1 Tax=Rhizoctonia solani TaxID=456999 RepID=A0A8H3BFB1_9AGAM|nr:unnamed protein product [Rhizoctonia solani]